MSLREASWGRETDLKGAQWDWFCKFWKNWKLDSTADLEGNCYCGGEDAGMGLAGTGCRREAHRKQERASSFVPQPCRFPPVPSSGGASHGACWPSRNVVCRIPGQHNKEEDRAVGLVMQDSSLITGTGSHWQVRHILIIQGGEFIRTIEQGRKTYNHVNRF